MKAKLILPLLMSALYVVIVSQPAQGCDYEPPIIEIISPENETYAMNSISLIFTLNEAGSWIGFSLDEQTNVTTLGNTTLTSLPDGGHNVVVYANDTHGNMGTSNTVYFTVDTTPPNITSVSQTPLSDNVSPEDEVRVDATVIDILSGVKQVILNYSNGNGTWITINMTNSEGDLWNGTIPAFDYCTWVNYTIKAEDKVGNIANSKEIYGYQHQYHVIPEFSSSIALSMFVIAALLTAIAYRRKDTLKA